jgi:RND family efflux transporter MFP subunit
MDQLLRDSRVSAGRRRRLRLTVPLLLACVTAVGCHKAQTAANKAPPPKVTFAYPVEQKITDYEEFPGNLDAVYTVQVRARAQGFLTEVLFEDGDDVKVGQVLAVIQKEPYEAARKSAEAQLNAVKAQVKLADANLNLSKITLTRARASGSAATLLEIDQDIADVDAKEATLKLARANEEKAAADLETAQLNLGYTEICSPINGRISNRMVDPGNIVLSDSLGGSNATVVATIVSQDPIYAYFDMDERTMLKLKHLALDSGSPGAWDAVAPRARGQAGKEPRRDRAARPEGAPPGAFTAVAPEPRRKGGLRVEIGLADEDGFPHAGTIDFIDNAMNRATGTRRTRGVFDNPTRLLEKGMYCRVRVPVGPAHDALLVPEAALGTDQGRKYLYVLSESNKVFQRPVEVGSLHDGYRVILKDEYGNEGVRPGERIVVDGLQRVKSGIEVQPEGPNAPEPHKAPDRMVPLVPPNGDGKK